jgi:hypothetical protein
MTFVPLDPESLVVFSFFTSKGTNEVVFPDALEFVSPVYNFPLSLILTSRANYMAVCVCVCIHPPNVFDSTFHIPFVFRFSCEGERRTVENSARTCRICHGPSVELLESYYLIYLWSFKLQLDLDFHSDRSPRQKSGLLLCVDPKSPGL